MTGSDNDRQIEPFLKMCAQHSGVVSSESYFGLSTMEERLRTIVELQQKTQALENALKLRQSGSGFGCWSRPYRKCNLHVRPGPRGQQCSGVGLRGMSERMRLPLQKKAPR